MSLTGLPSPQEKELRERLARLNILEKDVRESFIRSSGPGGQNVNKVATCVSLFHGPSGLQVKCGKERSQGLNRYRAWSLLLDKIERRNEEMRLAHIRAMEKKKRQTRRRPKGLKEAILKEKRYQSEKKTVRRKVTLEFGE